jgi:murein DD-endopeptidase MepM/ murein hydrolase activator NlpD
VGADPLIVVNFESDGRKYWAVSPKGDVRSGDAKEAGEWVDYCNGPSNALRQQHGVKDPYNVRLWQIGNETSYDEGIDVDTAAKKTVEFARAMRQADPTIEIIGWGDSGWAPRMAEIAGQELQYIAFHNGFGPGDGGSPLHGIEYRKDPAKTREYLLRTCKAQQEKLDDIRRQVAKYNIPLALTECHFGLPGRNRCEVLSTWAAGVANACALNVHERNGDLLKIATLADFCGTRWQNNAIMIPVPTGKSYMMPVAMVMSLYRRHSGREAIEVTGTPTASTWRFVYLDPGESYSFQLKNGAEKRIRLVSVKEYEDPVIHLTRRADVEIEIDGKPISLTCAPYVMPTEVGGVRIQADTTSAWLEIPKRVQFSLWDASDPIVDTALFCFPLPGYRLFSHGMQAYNEPVHLGHRDGDPAGQRFYHNYGVDLAGYEGRQKVLSCIDGIVVQTNPAEGDLSIRDDRGFVLYYGHLDSILPEIKVGTAVKRGQWVGMLGRRGASGNFSHLHVGTFLSKSATAEGHLNRNLNLYPWLVAAYQQESGTNLYAALPEVVRAEVCAPHQRPSV